MKRFATILAVMAILLASTSAFAQTYGFSLSSSPVDGCVNTGAHAPGIIFLYVWYNYSTNFESLAAADMDLTYGLGTAVNLAFTPGAGWSNFAGPGDNVILGIGGCPAPPLSAGNFLIQALAPASFSLGGSLSAADCQVPAGQWPISVTGFSTDGSAPATVDGDGSGGDGCNEGTTSIEDSSFGSIKSLYR